MNSSIKPGRRVEEIWMQPVKKTTYRFILSLSFFIFASFLIYLPVIDHYFVSDDFKVLYRVCLEHTILIKNFFRPLSDVSIFLNYQLGGLNSIVFNSFNIIIHGINSYLIYQTALYFGRTLDETKRNFFALSSSLIFLSYPFHNEAVVWLLGRGASMACMFSLLSLIGFYKIENPGLKKWIVCFCYFISMSAFESTIFFPLIFILLLNFEKQHARSIQKWFSLLLLTLILHLLLRYWVAGTVAGNYGKEFFNSGMKVYFLNMGKVGGRLILPPSGNVHLLTTMFIILIIITGFFFIRKLDKIRQTQIGRGILCLSGMLVISSIIPVLTGISTQTSETDRLLYFPSVFFCMLAGLLIAGCINNLRIRWAILLAILCYNLFFLEKNNLTWKKAAFVTRAVAEKIISSAPTEGTGGKIYFIDIPAEIDGAYVFRQGFPEVPLLYGADQNRFIAVSYLSRNEMEQRKEKIILGNVLSEIRISPEIILKPDALGCMQIYKDGKQAYMTSPGDRIYFWNIDRFEKVDPCLAGNAH
jgi:protein O-mannosyl-transferase